MKRVVGVALVLSLFTVPVLAQSPEVVVTMEPVEVDTIACRFLSWTLTAAGTATASLRGSPAQADASPGDIITAGPTLSGSDVSITLTPDQGCGATGCRGGNWYQIKISPTGTGVAPTCNFLLHVEERYLTP